MTYDIYNAKPTDATTPQPVCGLLRSCATCENSVVHTSKLAALQPAWLESSANVSVEDETMYGSRELTGLERNNSWARRAH